MFCLAATPSPAPPGETVPFLWLAGFAVCFALHLILHPHARVFRDAMRWLGQNPAPLLWLMASLMLGEAWSLRSGLALHAPSAGHFSSTWPDALLPCLDAAWKRFALLFHQAVLPPPLWPGTPAGAAAQALISATGQVWLCCYLIASRNHQAGDATAIRRTAARWPTILALAVCHLPWWWVQGRPDMGVVRDWLLPEFFLFLAPLPLAAASEVVDFVRAGALSLVWWTRSWFPMVLFALTALPLLVLLEFSLAVLPELFPASRLLLRVVLESTLASAVHVWLFVSAALLLLRGAYVPTATPDD